METAASLSCGHVDTTTVESQRCWSLSLPRSERLFVRLCCFVYTTLCFSLIRPSMLSPAGVYPDIWATPVCVGFTGRQELSKKHLDGMRKAVHTHSCCAQMKKKQACERRERRFPFLGILLLQIESGLGHQNASTSNVFLLFNFLSPSPESVTRLLVFVLPFRHHQLTCVRIAAIAQHAG
ncbi:hypothetical protein TGMAS_269085 [Toxoplasma gondii MAS]|uniref:Uncharacterized protein n=1 Tax=Toxoplasma gondii MAS TaxID=943118 RepID=A0A086QW13_TOXGO|nr:hypothetical protein TGMAS_269085 [Toxoplasma gondii MAS]